MLHKIGYNEKVVFSGGVAKNLCIVKMLEEKIGIKIYVPSIPDIVGAMGSALFAGN
jgi:activator of 2-hydroxyglutaryl-CoA dehydratase